PQDVRLRRSRRRGANEKRGEERHEERERGERAGPPGPPRLATDGRAAKPLRRAVAGASAPSSGCNRHRAILRAAEVGPPFVSGLERSPGLGAGGTEAPPVMTGGTGVPTVMPGE